MAQVSKNSPILTVSVAAELAGMHAQTVRQYDRLGLVVATRTKGGGRRYSLNDVDRLVEIQRMSHEDGINLAGISKIMELRAKLEKAEKRARRLQADLEKMQALGEYMGREISRYRRAERRVFAAGPDGDVTIAERLDQLRRALREEDPGDGEMVVWRPRTLIPAAEASVDAGDVRASAEFLDAPGAAERIEALRQATSFEDFDDSDDFESNPEVDDFESLADSESYVVYDDDEAFDTADSPASAPSAE